MNFIQGEGDRNTVIEKEGSRDKELDRESESVEKETQSQKEKGTETETDPKNVCNIIKSNCLCIVSLLFM